MARRYVVDTWNNAAAPKKPKPVVPIRYRISPVEKDLDALDSLESELEREFAKGGMELDQYAYLHSVLRQRRGGLSLKRRKAIGETIEKPRKAAKEAIGRVKASRTVRYDPFAAKLKIVVGVFAFIFLKNFLNGA